MEFLSTTLEKIKDMQKMTEKVMASGGTERIQRQHSLGKMTARERIEKLLDADTFMELDLFVTHRCSNFGMETQEAPAEGVVTGYGTIDSRLVYVFAQDFTVVGGSLGEMHAAKICKVQEMAMKMGAPIIAINDSGGARIQEAVDALSGYGKIFYRNTLASGVIPQISAIMGPCAGGAVYSPALTDFIYMVKNTSQMFITGPQVIKTVTGEEVSAEQLGGAITHNATSGVAHFVAENDNDCLEQIRRLISFLPSNNLEVAPIVDNDDNPLRIDAELNTIIPDHSNQSYDMKDIIAKIVDNGDFYEVQPYYAANIITTFARLDGKTVGIIANQPKIMAGCLDINASDKSSRFIRFCDGFNIPILNLVDVPGFLPGTNQEYGGIIRHGAKMLYAYSEATVPKVTLVLRKAYGGAYLAMCSRDLGADQVLAWPTAEIAVMGPAGAIKIVNKHELAKAENRAELEKQLTEKYKNEIANPYKAEELGLIDEVIEPSTTRDILIMSFDILSNKQFTKPERKHGSIPL